LCDRLRAYDYTSVMALGDENLAHNFNRWGDNQSVPDYVDLMMGFTNYVDRRPDSIHYPTKDKDRYSVRLVWTNESYAQVFFEIDAEGEAKVVDMTFDYIDF